MKTIIIASIITLCLISSVLAYGPAQKITLVDGVTPVYTVHSFTPLIFHNDFVGKLTPADSQRTNNYAFTGEQLQWKVLALDSNGVNLISKVVSGWSNQINNPVDSQSQIDCVYNLSIQPAEGAVLSELGYTTVIVSGQAKYTFNSQTMREYICTRTIGPNEHGRKWFGAVVTDSGNLSNSMAQAESWFFNPSIDLTTSGNLNFGTISPGGYGHTTLSIKSNPEQDSGVQIVIAIQGTDFYDPSNSGASCPTTNQLKLQGDGNAFTNGFWYTASMGGNSVGNKRIPYGNTVETSDPIFSTSSSSNNWSYWAGNNVFLTPGSSISMTLYLGLPVPCYGQFSQGELSLWALPA